MSFMLPLDSKSFAFDFLICSVFGPYGLISNGLFPDPFGKV
jgi:hypothetical protein